MKTPFCVATRVLGQRSETFVKRHACDVLPGRTAAICEYVADPLHWSADGPIHAIYGGLSRPRRKIQRLLNASLSRSADARRLREFLKVNGVEAVMVEFLDSFLEYMPVVQACGVRWYSFGHGFDVSSRLAQPEWVRRYEAHHRAEGIFVRAEVIRQRLIALGFPAERTHVVHGGIDVPDSFLERTAGNAVRAVAVGRMMPKKGPILTLKAMEAAFAKCPTLTFDYIGEGPLFAEAKAYVADRNLQDRVRLLGGQPPEVVMATLRGADIFVQHSIRDPESGDEEGLPAAVTEAMALGLPVVSTIHAGIPEAVIDGEQGYLVNEGDWEAMGCRLAELAEQPDIRRQMGEAGWRRAKAMFTWEGERQRILELTGMDRHV